MMMMMVDHQSANRNDVAFVLHSGLAKGRDASLSRLTPEKMTCSNLQHTERFTSACTHG